jgi:rubrerythrin
MDYQEALNMALGKEKSAAEMYRKLSIEHTALKDLFEALMNEEMKHVKLIEKKITELYR